MTFKSIKYGEIRSTGTFKHFDYFEEKPTLISKIYLDGKQFSQYIF